MPYGMPGGDTPEKDKWMENCVNSVGKSNPGKSKGDCIAICKVSYMKSHKDTKAEEAFSETSLRETMDLIQKALDEVVHPAQEQAPGGVTRAWVVDVFDSYIIAETDAGYFKIDYSLANNKVVFSNPVQVQRKIVYEPVAKASSSVFNSGRRITMGNQTIS